jgi:TetR/AcrR family transcriptional regulator, repressor for uid operon
MNQHLAPVSDHRTRILDAAQCCFVRSGFHRATVQDVAAEAGMSAGNIYRYFASKNQIIAGLCARDRADLAGSFAALSVASEPIGLFLEIGRKHLVEEPREKAVFLLDLWAETARNPEIAAICREFEVDISAWMTGFLQHLIAHGQADPRLDAPALTQLLLCMSDGLLSRRAREPEFDPARQLEHINHVLRLACAGEIPSLLRTEAETLAGTA